MIPLQLSLHGFLSYRDPVELNFTTFDLACISGPNGSGKSSLLDAMTYALFGRARKWDESLINNQSDTAWVEFTFAYEGNIYRIQRSNPRGSTTNLDFFIHTGELDESSLPTGPWKSLTGHILRETQQSIENILRLDYETFVNASFFLQGKADLFTQQRPGDRKRILGSILGLEIWETFRQQAADQRREVESDVDGLERYLKEINSELEEEEPRKNRLRELQEDLERLSTMRETQEATLRNIRQITATLREQRKFVETLARQLEASRRSLNEVESRLQERREERQSFTGLLSREEEIRASYTNWMESRQELERWDEVAARFREQELLRQEPLTEIEAAGARLNQEAEMLQARYARLLELSGTLDDLHSHLGEAQKMLDAAEQKRSQKTELESELQIARQKQYEARTENPKLKAEMEELKERITQLSRADGAVCPLCGQSLGPEEREALVEELNAEGTALGDKFRANKSLLEQADAMVENLAERIEAIGPVEDEIQEFTRQAAQLNSRVDQINAQLKEWEEDGSVRLAEVTTQLEERNYAPEARKQLAQIDAELKSIGYDAAAHDAARRQELEQRKAQEELASLEKAEAALKPLDREISDLEAQIQRLKDQAEKQEAEHAQAAAALATGEEQAPDLQAAEDELLMLQERENRLRMEVGAAQQKVLVLDDLLVRKQELTLEREALVSRIGRYKQLERAFGKDGVPALLIEQAIPQIEARANELLDRLSAGNMSVRFATQTPYKDKRREDLRETLDIQISDSAGVRDYEMYSGGEAFRVNFAIRLALSEVLAQRVGARLQTLVIDEGFGSQDALGRQRLIEAINLVRPDFAKILVITHIEELKDAFPTRIEVEKAERGSAIRVI